MPSSLKPLAFLRPLLLHSGGSHTVEVERELNTWVKSAVETRSAVFLASRTCQQLSNSTLYLTLFLLVLLAQELTTASTMCNSSPWGRKCTARPFLSFLLLHLLLVLLRLVRFMPQPTSFILHSRPTWNDMQPEAEGSSSCKASTVMERSTLVLTVLLTFGATYFATAYTVYIDFFKALLLGVDMDFWKSITLCWTTLIGRLVLYCNAEWNSKVFRQRLVFRSTVQNIKILPNIVQIQCKICYFN